VQGLNTTIKSTYNTNIRGTLINIGAVGANDKTTIAGYNTEIKTTYTSLNSAQTFVNGEKTEFNQQGTNTTISKNGISTAGSVTAAKMYTQGLDVGNEIINLKNRTTASESAINNLQNTKADKVEVAQQIQHSKKEAIRISNEYTDEKIKEVNHKLDLEIEANKIAQNKLDDKINSNDEKINQRVRDLEIKVDNRFNAVMSYVNNEFTAVNNRLEGLGASMVALSAAATSSVYNSNKPTNLNIATGVYGKGYAIAGGLSHFFNSQTKVSVNWSQGSNTKNAVGVGVGFAF
jgi:hypothetical protein